MHFSGCSASCAQPQIADIGLRGDVAHVGEHIEEAVDIGLGGSLGPDAGFIDWVAGAVPVDSAPAVLSNLLVRFAEERRNEEPFYAWARRTDNQELREIMAGADGSSGDAT
jgi:ferredoxin-nitrite reductase